MANNNNGNHHVLCHFYINNNRNDNNNYQEVQVHYVATNDFLQLTEISVSGTNDVAIQAVAQILHRIGNGVSFHFLVRYITSHLPPVPDENNHNDDNDSAGNPNFIELLIPASNVLAEQEQQEHANEIHQQGLANEVNNEDDNEDNIHGDDENWLETEEDDTDDDGNE